MLILPPVEVVVETVAFTAGADSVFRASVATEQQLFHHLQQLQIHLFHAGPIMAKISSTFVAFSFYKLLGKKRSFKF